MLTVLLVVLVVLPRFVVSQQDTGKADAEAVGRHQLGFQHGVGVRFYPVLEVWDIQVAL